MPSVLSFGVRVLLVLLGTTVQAISLPQQHPLQDSNSGSLLTLDLPGSAKFRYCDQSRPSDLYPIERIDLDPQPIYMCVPLLPSLPQS